MFLFGIFAIVTILAGVSFIIIQSTRSWVEFNKIYRLRGLMLDDHEKIDRLRGTWWDIQKRHNKPLKVLTSGNREFYGHPLGTTPSKCPKCQGNDKGCPLCEGEGVVYIED